MEKRDWKKIVDQSGGTAVFAPEKLLTAAKSWQQKRLDFNKEIARLAKLENELTKIFNDLIYDVRNYYEEAGMSEIHTKDVGFDANALKEGIFIINITESVK